VVELPLDRDDVNANMEGLFDLNRKADEILWLLREDESEEEEED
jgi:hypothetical protein